MLPVMPLPLPGMVPVRPRAFAEPVSSVAEVASVERGPLPSSMVGDTEGSVAMVVGTVVVSVGMVATVGMVVGSVVGAGFEFLQPQPVMAARVRTRRTAMEMVRFIRLPP